MEGYIKSFKGTRKNKMKKKKQKEQTKEKTIGGFKMKYKDYVIILLLILVFFSFYVYYNRSDCEICVPDVFFDSPKCLSTCLEAGLFPEFCEDFCDDFEVNFDNFLPENVTQEGLK